jgi:hypothetical protein
MDRRCPWAVVLAVVTVSSPLGLRDARSQEAAPSYWGPIPAEADSVRAPHETAGREGWEWPLYVPWRAVSLPFEGLNRTLRYSYLGLDKAGVIAQLRRMFRPLEIPYGFSVSGMAGNITGLGLGVNLFHDAFLADGNHLQLKVSNSTRGHERYTLGFASEQGPWGMEVGAGYRKTPNARYYGIGPFAPEDAESRFTQEISWAGASLEVHPRERVTIEVGAMYTTLRSRGPRPDDDAPSIEERYADALPPGYGEDSDGWVLQASLQHGDADSQGRPRRGGQRRAVVAYYTPAGSKESGYAQYRGSLQQFLPLWFDRVLALRGYVSWIGLPADRIHFQRLLSNDDPDVFRGYSDFRFRDRGMLGLNVEYRYPVWAYQEKKGTGVDAYVFFDWAQVYGSREEIGLRALTESYGLGFRLVSHRGFSARAEVGFSEEGHEFRLRTDQVFQFHKRGFYHGRIPVPPR